MHDCDAVVIGAGPDGKLHYTRKSGRYSVSTNWNLSFGQDDYGPVSDRRYDAATLIARGSKHSDASVAIEILKAIRLPSTLYSYVVDLKTGRALFFTAADFSKTVGLDMIDEIAQGRHECDMTTLLAQTWRVLSDRIAATSGSGFAAMGLGGLGFLAWYYAFGVGSFSYFPLYTIAQPGIYLVSAPAASALMRVRKPASRAYLDPKAGLRKLGVVQGGLT